MTVTGADIWDEALRWVGTPFHHLGRTRLYGVDCLGLILGVAEALGIGVDKRTDYSSVPSMLYHGVPIYTIVTQVGIQVEVPKIGVVAYMHRLHIPHFGFLDGQGSLMHVDLSERRVVVVGYDRRWQRRMLVYIKLRGVV